MVKKALLSIMEAVKSVVQSIKTAISELGKFIANYILYIEYFCMQFRLDQLTTYTFAVDGVVYPGGKQDEKNKVIIKTELKFKTSTGLLKEIAKEIAAWTSPRVMKLRKDMKKLKEKKDEMMKKLDEFDKKNREVKDSDVETVSKTRSELEV